MMPNYYLPPVNTIPNSLLISAITQSLPMVVSVILANNAPTPRVNTYHVGMNVRLFVPRTYGMYQADNLVGTIISINGNDLALNLDSTSFDSFSIPMTLVETPASISPYGSRNLEYDNTTDWVPFQSLNNIGN